MSDAAQKLLALRSAIARAEISVRPTQVPVPFGHAEADACLKGGLRRGVLHEVFAQSGHESAASGFAAALAFLVAARKRVLWIAQDFSTFEFGMPAATGFLELGIAPERLLSLRVANVTGILRGASDALSCAGLGAVVLEVSGEPKLLDLVATRRLTLASAHKGVTAFLLRFKARTEPSTAETRWHVRAALSPEEENWGRPAFRAELVRNRHGRTGQFTLEWNGEDGRFEKPAADIGPVVSAPADGSFAATLESKAGTKPARHGGATRA